MGKMNAALFYGPDIQTYRRGYPKIIKEIPATFGHEFQGTSPIRKPGSVLWRRSHTDKWPGFDSYCPGHLCPRQ